MVIIKSERLYSFWSVKTIQIREEVRFEKKLYLPSLWEVLLFQPMFLVFAAHRCFRPHCAHVGFETASNTKKHLTSRSSIYQPPTLTKILLFDLGHRQDRKAINEHFERFSLYKIKFPTTSKKKTWVVDDVVFS